ncbi:MAG: FtsX-like permease family protein [Bacteroidota bacterium]
MNFLRALFASWTYKMAWRDSRTHRRKLLMFMSSIVLGVASLVAIDGFGESMQASIATESKSLLGADLALDSKQKFSEDAERLIDSIGRTFKGEQARQTSFTSMIYLPKSESARFAQIRALEGNFPFYGDFETEPAGVTRLFKNSEFAVIDESFLKEEGGVIGDTLQVGAAKLIIKGLLKKAPGEASVVAMAAPRVYIPVSVLEKTGLLQQGSRMQYKVFFKFPENVRGKAIGDSLDVKLTKNQIDYETPESRQQALELVLDNVNRFLKLLGFIALLLGGAGVASAVYAYIRQKLPTIAVLRCLGATASQTFAVYCVQAIAMGFIGSVAGALVGVAIQYSLPAIFKDLIPSDLSMVLPLRSIGRGILTGVGMSLLFAMLPLLSIRKVEPFSALRASFEEGLQKPDPLRFVLYAVIAVAVYFFAYAQTENYIAAAVYSVSLAVVFGALALAAIVLRKLLKAFFPGSFPYVWRQGLANLFRPNNQTLTLMVSLGFGTFLISMLYIVQSNLLNQLSVAGSAGQPNFILFDVQKDQRTGVLDILKTNKAIIVDEAPIVSMRLETIKGKTIDENSANPNERMKVMQREYRVTYRNKLADNEELTLGTLQKRAPDLQHVQISLADRLAELWEVKIGDEIRFNVQGLIINAKVGSLRKVNFRKVQTSFQIVFPPGVLEDAPQFYTVIIKTPNKNGAQIQSQLAQKYPNVSAIDLGLILETVDKILQKVASIIRFMALFSVVTGLTVLASSIIISRYQRSRENVLLRTLGATGRQITLITLAEYFLLGLLAALTGMLLSYLGSWLMVTQAFRLEYKPEWALGLVIALCVALLVMIMGFLNSRSSLKMPPLEVLRSGV